MSGNQEEYIQIPRQQAELHARSAALLDKLLGDPRVAPQAEELIAKVNPDAKFPGRDMRDAMLTPVKAQLDQERAAREALEARLNARDAADAAAKQTQAEQDLMNRLNSVKSKRGFSDDVMNRVMDRMREQNNPDVDAAAAYVAESIPKPSAVAGLDYLGGNVDVYGAVSGDTAWKGLHENPNGWLTQELRNIAHDPEFARMGNVA